MHFTSDVAPFAKKIASDIHCARKRAGLTQAHLAQLAGVRPATVWQAENNPTHMQLETLNRILTALHMSVGIRPLNS